MYCIFKTVATKGHSEENTGKKDLSTYLTW